MQYDLVDIILELNRERFLTLDPRPQVLVLGDQTSHLLLHIFDDQVQIRLHA